MGRKKHSENSVCGKGKLTELVAEIYPEDGKRYGHKTTHKGLSSQEKHKKPKHKRDLF